MIEIVVKNVFAAQNYRILKILPDKIVENLTQNFGNFVRRKYCP